MLYKIKELIKYLFESEVSREWIYKIHIEKSISKEWGSRIRDLLYGYALLDIADWTKTFLYLKNKMWRLFEDLTYEIFKEALRVSEKNHCNIIRVDRLSGFKGLDFIVINDKKGDWTVGIQCKRYISTGIPASKVDKYGSYSRSVSASGLLNKSHELRAKYGNKKLVLVTFEVYYKGKRELDRFLKLKNESEWDKIIVFNRLQSPITKYKLTCNGLKTVINWC